MNETSQDGTQTDRTHAARDEAPRRLWVEVLFWGLILVILGHMIFWRLAGGMAVAPHGIIGRLLALIGAAAVARKIGSATPEKRRHGVASIYASVMGLACVVWFMAWAWGRLIAWFSAPSVAAVVARRAETLIALADCTLIIAALAVAYMAGAIRRKALWRVGGYLTVWVLCEIATGLVLPRSWAWIRDNAPGLRRAVIALQLAYWTVLMLLLRPIRNIGREEEPAPDESSAPQERLEKAGVAQTETTQQTEKA